MSEKEKFNKLPDKLTMDKDISEKAKMLYVVLYSHCIWKKDILIVQIDQATLAKELSCCVRTVRSCIKELKFKGWINVKNKGYNRPNIMTLHKEKKRGKCKK